MADKSFALKVELQGDVEKFRRNMEKAKAYTAGFAKGAEASSKRAGKATQGLTGKIGNLTGALQAAGGGAGVGILAQGLQSLTSPAGMATAAIAGIALAIRSAQKDMQNFELTTDAMLLGIGAFLEGAKKLRKEEKSSLRGGILSAQREIIRLARETRQMRSELEEAQAAGDTTRAAQLSKDIAAHVALIAEKRKLDRKYTEGLVGLGIAGAGKREAKEEFAAGLLMVAKADRDSVVAKRKQKEIEREIMELSAVMAVNSAVSNEERLAAVDKTKELRAELLKIAKVQQTQIDAHLYLNSLGMNTLEDEAKVTALMTEREKLLKKMVTSQKEMDNTLARIAKHEEAALRTKAKAMIIEQDMLKIAQKRQMGVQYSPGGGDSTRISGAGAGLSTGISEDMVRIMEEFRMFQADMDYMVQDFIAYSIGNIAAGIGEALVTGGWETMFQQILSSFGSFLVQMGGMMVAYGVAQLAFSTALKSFPSPAGAVGMIAAGAAMALLGGVMSGAASSFASGGSSSSSGGSSASFSNDPMVLKFELEGDKLVAVTNNYNRKQGNIK